MRTWIYFGVIYIIWPRAWEFVYLFIYTVWSFMGFVFDITSALHTEIESRAPEKGTIVVTNDNPVFKAASGAIKGGVDSVSTFV